jgi:hypothetical protein
MQCCPLHKRSVHKQVDAFISFDTSFCWLYSKAPSIALHDANEERYNGSMNGECFCAK